VKSDFHQPVVVLHWLFRGTILIDVIRINQLELLPKALLSGPN